MERLLIVFVTWLAVLACLASATTFQYNISSDEVIQDSEDDRIRGVSNRATKDIVLGGLFPVHTDSNDGASCGPFRRERGLERMEAMLYSLDLINSDDSLLPNITLGYDIRDTCNSENIGLDESLDLVAVSDTHSNAGSGDAEPIIPTTAVVGAAASAVSVPVASLLRLFAIPQVSYASSSARLNNRDRYGYFFRTIPPDDYQARAMYDLCLEFDWTYVAIVYVNNFYGEPGIDEFRRLAVSGGKICISVDRGIDETTTALDVANELMSAPPAVKVVVLFADHVVAGNLLQELTVLNSARNERRRFIWIASDAWAGSSDVVDQFSEDLVGLFGFTPLTDFHQGFEDYFSQLTPTTNRRNPWFPGFYEAYYECSINGTSEGVNCSQPLLPITSAPGYSQGNFIPLVIDAVHSVAHVLHNFLQENCDSPIEWNRQTQSCNGQRFELNGENLLDFFYNVTFISPTNDTVSFDNEGNVQGRYEITNYQKTGVDSFAFMPVGQWIGSATGNELQFDKPLQFGLNKGGNVLENSRQVDSQCQTCPMGQVIRMVQSSCCGVCDPCVGQNYSNSTTDSKCQVCPDNYWGNNPLVASNSCVALPESYPSYGEPWGIILLLVGALGLIAVIATSVIFGVFWTTPIVKSSGREQMIILLVGITICFFTTIFYTSKPSAGICFFQRFNLWLCFSLILGALLVKLIRIARIFLRSQTSTRPRFIEPRYQVLLTAVFVGAQMVLVLISLTVEYPLPTTSIQLNPENSLDFPTLTLSCVPSNVVVLVFLIIYSSALVIVCNILALLTIKFPENFNEAKYVSFSTFTLGLIWLAFIPTYLTTNNEFRTAVICFALNMSAFAVLGCMFFPRAFIMVFFPERNTPGYSTQGRRTTSTELTRQIGTVHKSNTSESKKSPVHTKTAQFTQGSGVNDPEVKIGDTVFPYNATQGLPRP